MNNLSTGPLNKCGSIRIFTPKTGISVVEFSFICMNWD